MKSVSSCKYLVTLLLAVASLLSCGTPSSKNAEVNAAQDHTDFAGEVLGWIMEASKNGSGDSAGKNIAVRLFDKLSPGAKSNAEAFGHGLSMVTGLLQIYSGIANFSASPDSTKGMASSASLNSIADGAGNFTMGVGGLIVWSLKNPKNPAAKKLIGFSTIMIKKSHESIFRTARGVKGLTEKLVYLNKVFDSLMGLNDVLINTLKSLEQSDPIDQAKYCLDAVQSLQGALGEGLDVIPGCPPCKAAARVAKAGKWTGDVILATNGGADTKFMQEFFSAMGVYKQQEKSVLIKHYETNQKTIEKMWTKLHALLSQQRDYLLRDPDSRVREIGKEWMWKVTSNDFQSEMRKGLEIATGEKNAIPPFTLYLNNAKRGNKQHLEFLQMVLCPCPDSSRPWAKLKPL